MDENTIKFANGMADLREKFQKLKRDKPRIICPVSHPRYDDVFIYGVKCLNESQGN